MEPQEDIERKFIRKITRFFRTDVSDEELCLQERQKVVDFFEQHYNEIITEHNHTLFTSSISAISLFCSFILFILVILLTIYVENIWGLLLLLPVCAGILFFVGKDEYLYYDEQKIVDIRSLNYRKQHYSRLEIYYSEIESVKIYQRQYKGLDTINFKLYFKNGKKLKIELSSQYEYLRVFAENLKTMLQRKAMMYNSHFESKW